MLNRFNLIYEKDRRESAKGGQTVFRERRENPVSGRGNF
jgi:hypothetical protein